MVMAVAGKGRGREKRRKLKKVLKAGGRGFLEGSGLAFLAKSKTLGHMADRLGGHPYEQLQRRVEQSGLARAVGKNLPWVMGGGMATYRMGRSAADEYMIPPVKEMVASLRQKLKRKAKKEEGV